ncbi:MAG: two component transcriptional regulator, LytTR family [Bacteroidetes bacterium]|nr:two component transcriptional regulator, LytTR family [Bacteroidota bacterium]
MKRKINAIAIDDEPMATRIIENFCSDIEFIQLEKSFNDPKAGLKYLKKYPVDLVFLDIDMPGMSGLELCKQIRQEAMIVFITSHRDLAVEGFNLDAVDYVTKPFQFERFEKAAKKAYDFLSFRTERPNAESEKYMYLRADYKLHKITISEIVYVEGLDDYVKVHIENQKTLVVRITMKKLLEKLPPNEFIRVHKSFIIAVNRINWIKTGSVSVGGQELPLGQNYAKAVTEVFHH